MLDQLTESVRCLEEKLQVQLRLKHQPYHIQILCSSMDRHLAHLVPPVIQLFVLGLL